MINKARFEYSCGTCGGEVTKQPVGPKPTKNKNEWYGLGGWACVGLCRTKGPKVTRKLL